MSSSLDPVLSKHDGQRRYCGALSPALSGFVAVEAASVFLSPAGTIKSASSDAAFLMGTLLRRIFVMPQGGERTLTRAHEFGRLLQVGGPAGSTGQKVLHHMTLALD